MPKIERYGLKWSDTDDLQIEMEFIRRGGFHTKANGEVVGHGLSYHFEQMRRIIWPELDNEDNGQRWHKITRDEILRNKVTVLMGPGSSGKTHSAAWIGLCKYWVDPENTCVLVSSTDIRGLKLRVWGEICMLWERGVRRFPYLAGHMLDSKLAITTDSLEDGDLDDRIVRDMRKGIVGIPTVQNGKQEIGRAHV